MINKLYLLIASLLVFCSNTNGQNKIWIQKENDKYILNIDNSILGSDMFIASRVIEISEIKNIAAGQTFYNPVLFNFNMNGKVLTMIKPNTEIVADNNTLEILKSNNLPSIWKTMPVIESDKIIKVDIGKFFSEEQPDICPLPSGFKTGKLEDFDSGVYEFENLPDRVNIKARYSYSGKRPLVVTINYTIMIAPEMAQMREWDERIGTNTINKTIYDLNNKIEKKKYALRWRIEPKKEDIKDYLKGKLVEPEKPIVFYLDSKIPHLLYKNVKLGLLDWNKAFEAIGFKNVIQVKSLPKDLNSEDILTSAFRYVPTDKANAMGANTFDPRTGEVLQGDIIWYHNVIKLLKDWRFIQTSAADPKARGADLSDDVSGRLIRYAAAHEMGHVLGFQHNMRASFAYPTDSLRSVSFTKKYGTTASIMDYARNNFVAQPEDVKRGVNVSPPDLGPYDYLSIEWLYRPFYDKKGNYLPLNEQKKLLNKLLVEKGKNSFYKFAKFERNVITNNPAGQADMLGDDVVKSSVYGVKNLKLIAENLYEWSGADVAGYERMQEMYDLMIKQFFKYMNCSASYIGGVEYLPYVEGDSKDRYVPISKAKTKEAVEFIITSLLDLQKWGSNNEIDKMLGYKYSVLLKEQKKFLSDILAVSFVSRLSENGGTYTYKEYVSDIEKVFSEYMLNNKINESKDNWSQSVVELKSEFEKLRKK